MKEDIIYKIDFKNVVSYDSIEGAKILSKTKKYFKKYEYKRDQNGQPVRVLELTNGDDHYADYLDTETKKLFRRVNTLSVDDRYIDDLNEEEYYRQCQLFLLVDEFRKSIDIRKVEPFQMLALSYLEYEKKPIRGWIRKSDGWCNLHFLNIEERCLYQENGYLEKLLDKNQVTYISDFDYYKMVRDLLLDAP